MFLTLCSPATRDFRPIIRGADFAQLALVLLLVPFSIYMGIRHPLRQHLCFFEDLQNFGNPQKFVSF